jgi:deoxycytidine triphosphate deaminase
MNINPDYIISQKILIPCSHTKVQQVGIDLTISEDIKLSHGSSYNVLLNEVVKLPKDIYSTFIHRSSYNRKGVLITGSIYDPGYTGVVGCTIYNLSGEELIIEKNQRIGQMVFFKADPASEYQGQYNFEYLKK